VPIAVELLRYVADEAVFSMDEHVAYIEKLVAEGGPDPSEYEALNQRIIEISDRRRDGDVTAQEIKALRQAFGQALSTETLQGFAFRKPYGYPGDYEIIDRIYCEYIAENPELKKWDRFFHARSAAIAVRNRKSYFMDLMQSLKRQNGQDEDISVLNVASGPMRGVFEFLGKSTDHDIRFECIDADARAIEYAKDLCEPYLDRIEFHERNALRFKTDKQYKLVWSAGLFDYLDDKTFQFLLSHLLDMLDEEGELVVGNFTTPNPTRAYMEVVCDWYLHHRTADELVDLSKACGIPAEDIRVGREPEEINLFLRIKKGNRFIELRRQSGKASRRE